VGITAGTARALAVAGWRQQPFSGSHDPAHPDPEPLSRVAPAVLFAFASREEAVRLASAAARTTCQVNTVLAACADLARALLAALAGEPKARILAEQSSTPARGAGKGAMRALAGALESFAAAGSFREAVLHAANLGGNSDVTAAVCGQLAGAFWGASAITASWRTALLRAPLIESFADQLLAHALVRMG
jgi:ADP-ribosyl-[dinitrogen reductase] hydrolase